MEEKETINLILAIIILSLVIGFQSVLTLNPNGIGIAIFFAFIIIAINVFGKKVTASYLDSDVSHEIWQWSRFGYREHWHLKKPIPLGVLLPLIITAFTLGIVKFMTIITYETKAKTRRAAKKFGYYSFTEMTEWHNGLIGAAGIALILLLSFVTYWFSSLEFLARIAAFYAFFNMIPFSKLDGMQIYMGSRILWYILAIVTLIFTSYAIILV